MILVLSLLRDIAKPHPIPLDQSKMRLAVSVGLSTTRPSRTSVARLAFISRDLGWRCFPFSCWPICV